MTAGPVGINRGSDVDLNLEWQNGDASPMDITGQTVSFLDVSPELVGRLTTNVPAPTTGLMTLAIAGAADPLSLGTHTFRLQLMPAAISTPLIRLRVT